MTASFVDRLARALPLGRAGFRMLLPLFPAAIESFRLDDYDLVISSSHAVAKGARPPAGALCVSYVHSPMRYVWEAEGDYTTHVPGGAVGRAAFALVARYLRRGDLAVTPRAVALAANSAYTQARIQRYYGRAAQSRSSVLKRRDPSCDRAACVSDGANSRSDPGHRRSTSTAHARCSVPVASIPITGDPVTSLAATSRASSSTPSRSTGNDTGSPIRPRSPVVNQTRFDTFPGSIATTNRSPGTSLSSRPGDISPSR